jgi:hypothetical protein
MPGFLRPATIVMSDGAIVGTGVLMMLPEDPVASPTGDGTRRVGFPG